MSSEGLFRAGIGADMVMIVSDVALDLLFLDAHSIGYTTGLVFFGVNLAILGYLVFKSGYFPRILGVLLMVAS